jgi:hypothetical protein
VHKCCRSETDYKLNSDRPDDGGSTYLRNFDHCLPDYPALQPRKQPSFYSSP